LKVVIVVRVVMFADLIVSARFFRRSSSSGDIFDEKEKLGKFFVLWIVSMVEWGKQKLYLFL